MFNKLIFTVLSLLSFTTCGYAWYKSEFQLDTKLPKECGHFKSYSPINDNEFWPWIGTLTYSAWGRGSKCNAILIHQQAVITSLMCIKYIPEDKIKKTLFVAFSQRGSPSFQNISVTDVDFVGKEYNSAKLAILKLSKPVVISSRVHPVCLWKENRNCNDPLVSHIGMMVGADINNLYSSAEFKVYQTTVRMVNKQKCDIEVNGTSNKTDANHLCFTYDKKQVTCHGFGSTLIFPRLSKTGDIIWYLRSIITSRRWFCDKEHSYINVDDISHQRKWIESHFKANRSNTKTD